MINLKIGKSKVNLPNDWSEITIEKYARIIDIFKTHGVISEEDKENKTTEQFDYDCLRANKEAFVFLTGLSNETIEQCPAQQITKCLELMTKFLGEVEEKTYKDVDDTILSFKFKKETYFYPKIKFKETTFGDYIEASQLNMLADKQKGGRFSVLPEQIAIMCKTKEETKEYNEKTIMKKKKLFAKLPMNIVWDFVFFLTKQTTIWEKSFQTYSKEGDVSLTDMQKRIGA